MARVDGGRPGRGWGPLAFVLLALAVPWLWPTLAGSQPDTGADPDAGRPDAAAARSPAVAGDASVGLGPQSPPPAPDLSERPPGLLGSEPAEPVDAETPSLLLRSVLGLLLLLGLAWVFGHPRVRHLEEVLGISQAITSGFPFVVLGALAHHPSVQVLNEEVIRELIPLLHFGLGWLGFLVGFRFEVRFLEGLPTGTGTAVAIDTSLPFLCVAAGVGATVLALGEAVTEPMLRDTLALATAGAMTAPRRIRWVGPADAAHDPRLEQLDEIAGVLGLLFLVSFFRPDTTHFRWELPGAVWLFITIGLGVTVGLVLYVVVRREVRPPEFLALALGSVAFAAGLAGYLSLSPVVIGFVAGTVVANLPWPHKEELFVILERLERPIYLLFLAVVGARWEVIDWRGWVLVPAFLAARLIGRFGAGLSMSRTVPGTGPVHREARFVVAPLSSLAIAIVVSVQSLYEPSPMTGWIVTAVVGGAVVSEILVQLVAGRKPRAEDAA